MATPRTAEEFARSLPTPGYDVYAQTFQDELARGATAEQAASVAQKAVKAVTPTAPKQQTGPVKIVVTPEGAAKTVPEGADSSKPYTDQVKNQPAMTGAELYNVGVQQSKKNIPAIIKQIEQNNVIIGNYRMPVKSWNELPEKYQRMAIREGFDAMKGAIEKDENAAHWEALTKQAKYTVVEKPAEPEPPPEVRWKHVITGKTISSAERAALGSKEEKSLYRKDVSLMQGFPKAEGPTEYEHLITHEKISEAAWRAMHGEEKNFYHLSLDSGKGQLVQQSFQLAADVAIPGMYVARNWNTLSASEKAVYLALDVVLFGLPLAKSAVRGARLSGSLTRAGVMKGAAAGAGREVLAQLAGPVNLIVHPVGTAKGAVREAQDVAEMLLDPRRLPEVVVTTSYSTVRLPVSKFKTEAQAMAARDEIMKLAKQSGARVTVEAGDLVIEIERSSLMKALKGGLAHATPSGEKLAAELAEKGIIVVKPKAGLSAKEQGMFFSSDPLPRFAEATARGKQGEQAVIYIVGKETAEKAVSSAKIYSSPKGKVAELESVFEVEEKLPKPRQKLYTRLYSTGQRVEIWLPEKLPLAVTERLKRINAVTDSIKALYTPAARISFKNAKAAKQQYKALIRTLEKYGARDQARALRELERVSGAERAAARTAVAITARRTVSGATRREVTPRQYDRAVRQIRRDIRENTTPRRKVATRITRTGRTTKVERAPVREAPPREMTPPPPRERVPPPPREMTPPPPREEPPEPPPDPPPDFPRLPKGAPDKSKLTPEQVKSAVAFRMGQLGKGKKARPVTIALIKPYRPQDKVIYVGKTPEGMTVAPDQVSAKRTIQLLTGRSAPDITGKQGFATFRISGATKTPGAARMTFASPGYKSVKRGKVYHTKVRGGTLYSRRKL